ncbi:energy transducer TonB [Psychroserpens sp. XS_ASV72]|uniref:energy transducer TonB n=1 Tax=Psychroserpens sp. XS_ASV72 TaxID=3241293 RepID=UPI003515270D
MKKQTLIIATVIFTITVGSLVYFNTTTESVSNPSNDTLANLDQNMVIPEANPDFAYHVGTRFSPITKSEIDKATTIASFIDEDVMKDIVSIQSTKLSYFVDEQYTEESIFGSTMSFNEAQKAFLKTAGFSTNFAFRVDYEEKNPETGKLQHNYRSPHMTIVPETQAKYAEGDEALLSYLKQNSLHLTANTSKHDLKAAKLFFTVSKNGTIKNVRLDSTSGYADIDQTMMKLIESTPGKWIPAKNSNNENVDQELVISYGILGC